MKFFRKHKVMALILTAVIVFCFVSDTPYFCDTKNVSADTKKTSKDDLEDGVYTIQGKLRHATLNQPSMGDTALTQPMKIIKNGNELSLRLEFKSLTSGVFKGYLYGFNYFPSWTDSENIPKGTKAESVKVTEYYEGVYDEYNDSKNGTDLNVKGKLYPHYAIMPIKQNEKVTWVQVYVPVMEAISKGSGTQYARLILDWSTLTKTNEKPDDMVGTATARPSETPKTENTSSPSVTKPAATKKPTATKKPVAAKKTSSTKKTSSSTKKLDIKKLSDGKYMLTGQMVKTDKKSNSMSNKAINHNVRLNVKKGKYILTLEFSGLTVGKANGYLSRLKYFKSGYKIEKNGVPKGKISAVKVISYHMKNGKKLTDTYGTDYPKKVSFPMIKETKKDGYVPLQVFVPIMDAISKGSGTQPVYLKLNLKSITSVKKSTSVEKSVSAKKKTNKKSSEKSSDTTNNSSAATNGSSDLAGNNSLSNDTSTSSVNSKTVKNSDGTGKVYSCKIVPCYRHPVTQKVEDAGGESSYATGQGMVESVLGNVGMFEQDDNGNCYLTIRVGLMDYTSKHKFYVQKRGDSVWQETDAAVTKEGSDSNGKTADYCIKVPDKNSILKVSMYVQPMGRDVVFYAYPKDFKSGKTSGMNVTKITTPNKSVTEQITDNASNSDASDNSEENLTDTDTKTEETYNSDLSDTQGLSLSTQSSDDTAAESSLSSDSSETDGSNKTVSTTDKSTQSGNMTMAEWVVVLTISITLSGLILMAAGTGVVYYFRRNWRRWGEEMEDDEE